MSEILITELTNKTSIADGTGVFDLMMSSVDLHLNDEYTEGRITGTEYANVYLSAMQSTLKEAVSFLLNKQEADKKAELVVAQINEIGEKTDLIIAQTASAYEGIKASQDKTLRENLLNNTTVSKIQEETDLLQSKDLEEIAGTAREDAKATAQIQGVNYDIGIKAQQELNLKDKNGGVVITYTYFVDGVSGATTTTTNLGNVLGTVISTSLTDGTSTSIVSLEKLVLQAKDDLIVAQTIGFASDTKQKVLKQMNDGFAVALSIAGRGDIPEANQDTAIDLLTQEILRDVDSLVTIPTAETLPPVI